MNATPDSVDLPADFLMGTATAGLQIEGGPASNSWYRWADAGHVKDGSHPSRADDHWRRVREDVELLHELGCRTYRLGVEWARIEPQEGVFSAEALDHYRGEIELLRASGIVPLVTLHHFTNPLWLEDDGAWLDDRVIARFERYVRYVVSALGDRVEDWITINEPNVYLAEGYILAEWPPGRSSVRSYLRGVHTMSRAHAAAYRAIHELAEAQGRRCRVGVAHHLRVFDPAPALGARFLARVLERFVQGVFLDSMTSGTYPMPFRGRIPEAAGLDRVADFVGVNYYTRDIVFPAFSPGTLFSRREVATGAPVNDLGWEIYPEGLGRLVRSVYERYRLPIWITENGTCVHDDARRSDFLLAHLREISRLIADGVPVERYYHWTFMDNFEWIDGESAPFGLVEVDFETQRRTIRPSGRLFASLAGAHDRGEK